MDKHRADKLDKLFQEKLQQHEISPEENYWPSLEKSLNKISFYKFGWRHINIYNISLGIMLLAVPITYLIFQSNKKNTVPTTPKQEMIDSVKKSSSQTISAPVEAAIQNTRKKQQKQDTLKSDPNLTTPEVKMEDSLPMVTPQEEITPALPELPKAEEKKKPKKIIYVVQQDTIVEKDTVKVRRKRKK